MKRYQILKEYWNDCVHDSCSYTLTSGEDYSDEDFFDCATNNPNGCYNSEIIFETDDINIAKCELEKYSCSYNPSYISNYHEIEFELFELDEVVIDEDGDIEDYNFIEYAKVKRDN